MARLSKETETTLFRVVQQSLANIHRHSGSSRARIRIVIVGKSVIAEIGDEGRRGIPSEVLRGFYDGPRMPGVGLAGMRERIREMKGSFGVQSDTNRTPLAVGIPLR